MRLYTTLIRRASVFGLAAALVCACSPNPNGGGVTDTGTIVGTLVDARTQKAIGQAVVSVGPVAQSLASADNGAVRLVNVPTGTQTVHVSAIGYQPADIMVVVRKDQTSELGPSGIYQLAPTGP